MTSGTRTAYRRIGNVVETTRRLRASEVPGWYLNEVVAVSRFMDKYQGLSDGDRVLELGTGFVHWNSIVVKLFADVQLTMFDVVDDRLWKAFPRYVSELRRSLPTLGLPVQREAPAEAILERLLLARSFEEAYEVLGADYVIDRDGSLESLESGSYAMLVSLNVLEHLRAEIAPQVVAETYRLLRPGGYAMHQFDLTDHYSHFDPAMSPKNYLRFAPATWDRWLNNRVMYINRIQRPDWDAMLERAKFEILECDIARQPLGDISVHPAYELSSEDAETTAMRYLLRKS